MLRRTLHPKRSCTLHNPLNSTKNQEKLARDTTDIQNYISIMKSLLTRNKFKLDRDPEEEMNATEESQVQIKELMPISCHSKVSQSKFNPKWKDRLIRRKNYGSYGQVVKGYSATTHSKLMQRTQRILPANNDSKQLGSLEKQLPQHAPMEIATKHKKHNKFELLLPGETIFKKLSLYKSIRPPPKINRKKFSCNAVKTEESYLQTARNNDGQSRPLKKKYQDLSYFSPWIVTQ